MMRARLFTFAFFGALLTCALSSSSIAAPVVDNLQHGAFVTALARDQSGRTFIGTEDNGVWIGGARGGWSQYNTKNSALSDDNVYALAVDKQNRVWAGTGRGGVCVLVGRRWKNYGVFDGFLADRVLDIAVSPRDGDVWMATSAGLARYRVKTDKWSFITRLQGLPSDQLRALAFDAKSNLYIATQSDGLAIASPLDEYAKWRKVAGAKSSSTTARGAGLVSNNLNDVLVTRDGVIYVATNWGLSWSRDAGKTWRYARGADYADKIKNRFSGAPANWQAETALLTEDYVTCLAEDASNRLWIGHRQRAYEVWNAKHVRVLDAGEKSADGSSSTRDYVATILASSLSTSKEPLLIGSYGAGWMQLTVAPTKPAPPKPAPPKPAPIPHPSATPTATATSYDAPPFPSAPPRLNGATMRAITQKLLSDKSQFAVGGAAFLDEDWRTQGDWVGRYGRQSTVLCAMGSPFNHTFSRSQSYDQIIGQLGYNRHPDDSLRHWVHWLQANDNPKVLYTPIAGVRREAEWDDHAESYPMTKNGPDLWVSVGVPEGTHKLSLYFYNKDGHDGNNRFRDYNVELRRVLEPLPPWPSALPGKVNDAGYGERFQKMFDDYWSKRYELVKRAEAQPVLAQTRVVNFWGGVYKNFIVRGPAKYWIKVDKNYSFNTILQAVMLDRLSGEKTRFEDDAMSWMGNVRDDPPDPDAPLPPDPFLLDKILAAQKKPTSSTRSEKPAPESNEKTVAAARELWKALDVSYETQGGARWQWRYRMQAYRAAQAAHAPDALLENWRWKLTLWTPNDRQKWRETMARARWSLLQFNPELKTAKN